MSHRRSPIADLTRVVAAVAAASVPLGADAAPFAVPRVRAADVVAVRVAHVDDATEFRSALTPRRFERLAAHDAFTIRGSEVRRLVAALAEVRAHADPERAGDRLDTRWSIRYGLRDGSSVLLDVDGTHRVGAIDGHPVRFDRDPVIEELLRAYPRLGRPAP